LDLLLEEIREWAQIITYPVPYSEELFRRVTEFRMLGIKRFIEEGGVEVLGKRVLGKGTVGIVVRAEFIGGTSVAVKIRRLDASRPTLLREARILHKINALNVGPRLIAASRNFLVWKFVEGVPLDEWILKSSATEIRLTFSLILSQLWTLDRIGVAHNELSRFKDHILVQRDGTPVIIDFESSSENKFASNIPQFLGFLLNENSRLARILYEKLGVKKSREEIVQTLRNYKKGRASLYDIYALLE
jgi:putative serine/threonine protein kinase